MTTEHVPTSQTGWERRQRALVPVLTVVVICQLALYLGLRAPSLLAERGWRPQPGSLEERVAHWRNQAGQPQRDPQLGIRIPAVTLRGLRGGTLSLSGLTGKPVVLLMVGDGTGCSTKSLMAAWSVFQRSHPTVHVLAVADTRSKGLDILCRGERLRLDVAIDPELSLTGPLNARWKPRAYVFNPQGALCYVQADHTLDPRAIEDTTRLVSQFPSDPSNPIASR